MSHVPRTTELTVMVVFALALVIQMTPELPQWSRYAIILKATCHKLVGTETNVRFQCYILTGTLAQDLLCVT